MKPAPAAAIRSLLDSLAAKGFDLRPSLRAARARLAPAQTAGLVSIILPTRDRAATIRRAVDSVLAQCYLNWELLIIDDGGTDATRDVIRPYLAHRRIRYYRRPALGPPFARNAALRIARGEIVAYIDSDNDWDPEFLAGITTVFADQEVQSAYGMLLREEGGGEPSILFEAFDRSKLLQANFIDINVYVHRYELFTRFGGFDEKLQRMADWDLILRYTVQSPAVAVAVPAAHYRTDAANRLTDTKMFSPAYRRIKAKWRCFTKTSRPVRVLYALGQYPQLSEMAAETEIQAMLRYGVQVEIWSAVQPCAPYETFLLVHRGTLEAAIAAVRPDVVHVHQLNIAQNVLAVVQPRGIPITVRGQDFSAAAGVIEELLDHPAIRRIYLYPRQIAAAGLSHAKLHAIDNAFNIALFKPNLVKNRRLVVRAGAALPANGLAMFLQLALRFPEHRFVLCIVACSVGDAQVEELLTLRRALRSPAEIKVNLPHEQIADLLHEAGIYLHTAVPQPSGAVLSQPSSVIEAMASGCVVLVRNFESLVDYAGDAGFVYDDEDGAARLVSESEGWDDAAWRQAAKRSVERAWTYFTGDDDFHAIYQDWASLVDESGENMFPVAQLP